MKPIIIIGTGLAGYTLAREFRKLDKDTPVTMISMDDGAFYSKPMLSNAFAKGKDAEGLIITPAHSMADQLNAQILTHSEVTAMDPERQIVSLNGQDLNYSRLVLAWGAEAIHLPLKGDGASDVLSVNSRIDYAQFRDRIKEKHRVAIIGAGLIGCEFANDLRKATFEIDLVDIAHWPLGRLLPEQAGAVMRQALGDIGIRWHLGKSIDSVHKADGRYQIKLSGAGPLSADLVLSAVGLRPKTQMAAEAGIETRRGIVADGFLQTSARNVFTLGDCAEVSGQVLPYVMPIMHAARALAKTLSGIPTEVVYPPMPVIVKTPALPTVVLPAPPGVEGQWHIRGEGWDLEAVYTDSDGQIQGFALTGKAITQKQALAKQILSHQ
jgi:rubredoxin-NAD+ reductase